MSNKGDYSRIIYKPFKHYTGVLKQQGRVDLDADSNENHEIAAHLRQTLTQDAIGPCGFPKTGGGFAITGTFRDINTEIGVVDLDLPISPGRAYVDGLLCELEATPVSISEFVSDDNNEVRRVRIPTLTVDGRELQEGQWVEIFAEDTPSASGPLRIIDVNRAERILTFGFNIPDELRRAHALRRVSTYTTQPDYPDPPELGEEFDPEKGVDIDRTDLVYLDVWQRHITAIEDPDILEVALGGPDTTTRVKTVCQVKVMKDVGVGDCEDEIEGWPPPPSKGRLSTEVVPTPAADDPCLIAPGGGYRGLENRFYRVEIHKPGNLDEAKFKWSRDNGSVVFPIEEFVSGPQVRVKRIGQDQVLALHVGDWVEVLDDHTEYRQDHTEHGEIAGTMAKINDIDEVERIITLDRNIPASTYSVARHARIRRWDQTQNVDTNGLLTTAAGPIPLEDGIQVRFSGDNFKVGDHWSFAARTAVGDVERLTDAPPQGIKHHYCRLALIKWDIEIDGDNIEVREPELSDCRPTFPPLTDVEVRDWPTVQQIAWDNDKPMFLHQFNRGGNLGVRFSEPMKSATATLNTFIVTLELPLELSQQPHRVGGHWPFIVQGTIEAEDDDTDWEFHPQPIDAAILRQWLDVEQRVSGERRIRCRVVLKGNAILTRDGRPLDGEVFGRLRDDGTTDLIFPSGDGYKGGDFESWFFLVERLTLTGLRFFGERDNGAVFIAPGTSRDGEITLSGPAPPGGVDIRLHSDSELITVPDVVTVPAEQDTGRFQARAQQFRGEIDRTIDITASFEDVTLRAPLRLFRVG